MTSDIEARAMAYADKLTQSFYPGETTEVSIAAWEEIRQDYLDNSRAEIALERKRILDELLKLECDGWGISISKEALKKIVEGA